ALVSMPFATGQAAGFFAGISLIIFFSICYGCMKLINHQKQSKVNPVRRSHNLPYQTEISEEFHDDKKDKKNHNG
ncbi:MAG TPA: amino acid permease, partial [Lachnospiraceae bacterium]|nr:amino acid permease [Lachnospiraceae bacterium]